MKKIITLLLIIILLIVFTSCTETTKQTEQIDTIDDLYELIDKYGGDSKELKNIQISDRIDILEIQDGWTWTTDGDYTYIKGRVKNISGNNIRYFEVVAEYLDENNKVLDTDYTNSAEIIKPNNMKEFEIMHQFNSEYKTVRIYTQDIVFE